MRRVPAKQQAQYPEREHVDELALGVLELVFSAGSLQCRLREGNLSGEPASPRRVTILIQPTTSPIRSALTNLVLLTIFNIINLYRFDSLHFTPSNLLILNLCVNVGRLASSPNAANTRHTLKYLLLLLETILAVIPRYGGHALPRRQCLLDFQKPSESIFFLAQVRGPLLTLLEIAQKAIHVNYLRVAIGLGPRLLGHLLL